MVTGGLAADALQSATVDATLNPRVADLKASKTMQLADLASQLREAGKDIVSLAAGEPDFDTPEPIIKAGIEAMRFALPSTCSASMFSKRNA